MPVSVSDFKLAGDWVMKLFRYLRESKETEHRKTISECAQRLKSFADDAKRKNLRDRYYSRQKLSMQLVPHDQSIDEVLEHMRKEELARQMHGAVDLWEIAPFVNTGRWP